MILLFHNGLSYPSLEMAGERRKSVQLAVRSLAASMVSVMREMAGEELEEVEFSWPTESLTQKKTDCCD